MASYHSWAASSADIQYVQNERIVATALYYYSSENITRSSLAFRQLSSAEAMGEIRYGQDVHDFLSDVFGCENNEGSVQEVGGVETREGRLLTFPNTLQHQVQPFELQDKTKPGHRKILALFLVDPSRAGGVRGREAALTLVTAPNA